MHHLMFHGWADERHRSIEVFVSIPVTMSTSLPGRHRRGHISQRARPGCVLFVHRLDHSTKPRHRNRGKGLPPIQTKSQHKPYPNTPLPPNPGFSPCHARQKCICAECQSYQNVSRETFWYDWGLVPVKTDAARISVSPFAQCLMP